MARQIYNLTDATRETFSDNVKRVAAAWDKSLQWVYGILAEEKTDPFAVFLQMYRAVLKAGISTCHFDNELEFERLRHCRAATAREVVVCFKDKLQLDARIMERYVEALADGELDLKEIAELEKLVQQSLDQHELIGQALKLKRAELEKGGLRAC